MIMMNWKMPKNCIDCLGKLGPVNGCPCENTFEFKNNRHPDCPIVGEISDKHGRIVDVQNVMNQITICFAECQLKNVKVTPFILATYIAEAPTILEASK